MSKCTKSEHHMADFCSLLFSNFLHIDSFTLYNLLPNIRNAILWNYVLPYPKELPKKELVKKNWYKSMLK